MTTFGTAVLDLAGRRRSGAGCIGCTGRRMLLGDANDSKRIAPSLEVWR